MEEQQKYEEYLSIITDKTTSNIEKERAEESISKLLKCDEELDKKMILDKLKNKMKGIEFFVIDGKKIECNLEELLDEAISYYENVMPYPELYILKTDPGTIYKEVNNLY